MRDVVVFGTDPLVRRTRMKSLVKERAVLTARLLLRRRITSHINISTTLAPTSTPSPINLETLSRLDE
jgi:hypothetical protein